MHFSLNQNELQEFQTLKKDIAALSSIDEESLFVIECDASDVAVSDTLNQSGGPVAFMSRALQNSERFYPAVEKEATAVIKAVYKFPYFLITF